MVNTVYVAIIIVYISIVHEKQEIGIYSWTPPIFTSLLVFEIKTLILSTKRT